MWETCNCFCILVTVFNFYGMATFETTQDECMQHKESNAILTTIIICLPWNAKCHVQRLNIEYKDTFLQTLMWPM